jgi:hypothetical protein
VGLVRARYASSFDADVEPNPDAFVVSHEDATSEITACTGLTFASEAPLFSERYLDDPIESYIGRLFGATPDRQRVVEVGALASRRHGSGKELIRLASVITWCLGMQYVLCTATDQLISLFRYLKIPFAPLRAASRDRLAATQRERWGRYYDTKPVVGVIPLSGIASLISDTTGRYSFADPVVTLIDARTSRHPAQTVPEAES